MTIAYYNEIDPFCVRWLHNLIAAGEIAPGVVDERSVHDLRPDDLEGFAQVHLFAGIGVWSRALRDAGWPDDQPVWTGSCPCQPFSAAGRGGGFGDARHLWPHFARLVRAHRPLVVLGEQVASKDGLMWLDAVFADLEGEGYACGAVDTCAAGHGAPHIRQRLWWVGLGDAGSVGRQGRQPLPRPAARGVDEGRGEAGGLAEPGDERRQGERLRLQPRQPRPAGAEAGRGVEAGGLADTGRPGPVDGFWDAADWLLCRDGKWRPVEPGTFPLAHGTPARVGRLHAYGNAIVLPQAAAFASAILDITGDAHA